MKKLVVFAERPLKKLVVLLPEIATQLVDEEQRRAWNPPGGNPGALSLTVWLTDVIVLATGKFVGGEGRKPVQSVLRQ